MSCWNVTFNFGFVWVSFCYWVFEFIQTVCCIKSFSSHTKWNRWCYLHGIPTNWLDFQFDEIYYKQKSIKSKLFVDLVERNKQTMTICPSGWGRIGMRACWLLLHFLTEITHMSRWTSEETEFIQNLFDLIWSYPFDSIAFRFDANYKYIRAVYRLFMYHSCFIAFNLEN